MSSLVNVTRHETVAVVALSNPPVNALSHALRVALVASLKEVFAAPDVAAVVIACQGRTFIAGADIREFGKSPLAPDLPEVVEFLDRAPKLTVAAIHGMALGGGLELALACDFRVATAGAKVGLPEVSLGILPGAGGTQRLPRLIGVRSALDLIISGTPITATEALRLGLLDESIAEPVVDGAVSFARRVLSEGRGPRRVSGLSAQPDDATVFAAYERSISQRYRGFLAPGRCLEAVRGAVELPFQQGLELERELFRKLLASSESQAQRHAFFGEREVAKVPGLPDDTPTRPLSAVAVAGTSGTAVEFVKSCLDARLSVTFIGEAQEELERLPAALRESYERAAQAGRMTPAESSARLGQVRVSLAYEDASSADLLVEATVEDLEAKAVVLRRLGAVAKPTAIVASSSQVFELDALAPNVARKADLVGLRLAGTPRLLECERGKLTAPDAFSTAMRFGKTLGRVSVPVSGQVAQRLLARQRREAFFLLEEGALPEDVDRALIDFGFALGPLAALDVLGTSTALAARQARISHLSPRERACTILEELASQGRWGQSSGAGFYRHVDGQAKTAPEVTALLERHSQDRGIVRRAIAADEIRERCVYCVVNEAAHVLEEGLVARPLDIDMIWIHAFGFPVYRGGPLFFADHVGLGRVLELVLRYREQVGEAHWAPAPLLERLATKAGTFYGP